MLTCFKNLLSGAPSEEAIPTATRPQMSLEERQAYRREMIYQSVRECLLGLGALASMYRFQAMSVDERHHHFIVMIEVTHMFQARLGAKQLGFQEIEALIRQRTFERHGVVLQGMYWRVDENQASFPRARRSGDAPDTPIRPQTPIQRLLMRRYARQPYATASASEREQFSQAIRQGRRPPPIRAGDQAYVSDQAPLNTTVEVGETHYGQP
jgi:hypothetical protein